MTQPLKLSTALAPYGYSSALRAGDVGSERIAFEHVVVEPIWAAHRRMVRDLAFDVSQMSPTSFLVARAAGVPLLALPVFGDRRFHYAVSVHNSQRPIGHPRELEGKRVGINAWTVTTGMWGRQALKGDYGLDLRRVRWVAFDEPHVAQYTPPPLVMRAPDGASMLGMLVSGELDAAIGMEFETGIGQVPYIKHLIPDPEAADERAYRETNVYPMMNLIVIKEAIVNEHPWVAEELMRLFEISKRDYLKELAAKGPAPGIAFIDEARLISQKRIVGQDPLPFGLEKNRATIDAWIDAVFEQGLIPRRFALDEVFPVTLC